MLTSRHADFQTQAQSGSILERKIDEQSSALRDWRGNFSVRSRRKEGGRAMGGGPSAPAGGWKAAPGRPEPL